MATRNFQFYAELVFVTVLSLLAANMWMRFISQTLNRYFPGNLGVDAISAVVVTVLAVVILHLMFSKRKTPKDSEHYDSEEKRPEVRHPVYKLK